MYRFHVILQAEESAGRPAPRLGLTFDQVAGQLAQLPRMDVEPDGTLLWTGEEAGGERWQIEGVLYDGGASLAHVELKGSCPPGALDALLQALGWPQQRLLVQLPEQGVWLSVEQFRARAAQPGGAW